MKKIQANVSDGFAEFMDRNLPEAYRKSLPEEQQHLAPRTVSALLPTAIIRMASDLGVAIPENIIDEAQEATTRKPGPKKKDDRQLSLVDGKPGVWVSSASIHARMARVEHGLHELDLRDCSHIETAALKAVNCKWGAIYEEHGAMPGIRLIPPGTSLIPDPPKPPKPNVTEVGTFVSEARVQEGAIAILADGRIVPRIENDKLGESVIRFKHATLTESESELPDETKNGILSQRTRESFRIAGADAVEIGWTVRRETRRGVRGFRYIPPGTKLRFILPEQEVDMW